MAFVDHVTKFLGVGGQAGGPFRGDRVVRVGGTCVLDLVYEQVVHKIKTSPRPITLVFR